MTSRISAPTEKAEVIQILYYGVNRSLVTITGNGCSLKQILSSIKIMIYCRFRFVFIEIIILFSQNYHCQYHWLYDFWYITYFSSAWRGVCWEIFRHINVWYPHKAKIIGTYIEIKQFHVIINTKCVIDFTPILYTIIKKNYVHWLRALITPVPRFTETIPKYRNETEMDY